MTTISVIRGDSHHFTVRLSDGWESIPFEDGDKLYFTVKRNTKTDKKELQKVITDFKNGAAEFSLRPEDTKDMGYGKYKYDMQLTYSNGDVVTIVPPSDFVVEGEVTYE